MFPSGGYTSAHWVSGFGRLWPLFTVRKTVASWGATVTDDELRERFDRLDEWFDRLDGKVDNLTTLQEETDVKIGAIETRFGAVESAVNRIAQEAGVRGVPALGGGTRQPAGLSRAAKGR